VYWSQRLFRFKRARKGMLRRRCESRRTARRRSAVRKRVLRRLDHAEVTTTSRGRKCSARQGDRREGQTTDALHSIMSHAGHQDGYIYGVCSYGSCAVWKKRRASAFGRRTRRPAGVGALGQRLSGAAATVRPVQRAGLNLILAKLSPQATRKFSRATSSADEQDGWPAVIWSHPAFANQCVYAATTARLCACVGGEEISIGPIDR